MGGEWEFNFDKTGFNQTDLQKYQNFLLELREKYKKDTQENKYGYFYDGELPPKNNLFALFTYNCERHNWHQNAGWYILWNPLMEELTENLKETTLHARCPPYGFTIFSNKIQKELIRMFPKYFDQYFGDGLFGYGENEDFYDRSYNSDDPDFTACDQECGYCGKCEY